MNLELEERVKQLEFQNQLLFTNSSIDRHLFETNVTKVQYIAIQNLMDDIQEKLDAGEEVQHYTFESEIYKIVPERTGDYHFCKSIAMLFAEDGQWKEVFPALYGGKVE